MLSCSPICLQQNVRTGLKLLHDWSTAMCELGSFCISKKAPFSPNFEAPIKYYGRRIREAGLEVLSFRLRRRRRLVLGSALVCSCDLQITRWRTYISIFIWAAPGGGVAVPGLVGAILGWNKDFRMYLSILKHGTKKERTNPQTNEIAMQIDALKGPATPARALSRPTKGMIL